MKAKPTNRPGEVTLELQRRDEPLMDAATRAAVRSPFKLKNILAPIDFSECSKKALRYAIPLAKEHDASITLLYVVPPQYPASEYGVTDYVSFEKDMRARAETQLATLVADEVRGEVPAKSVVRTGLPAIEIIEAAKKLETDLIVVSTHGRTGLRHVLLGSVAEDVVRRAPCPVLVVRECEHEFLAK